MEQPGGPGLGRLWGYGMAAEGASSLANTTVLMVEDDPTMRAAVGSMLRAAGCLEVLQTGNGHDALHWMTMRQPDLVLCDCQMPLMDGMTFLRKLREVPGGATVPVIMLTANQSSADAWEARQLNVAAWLLKPVAPQNVVAQAAATLGLLPPRVPEDVLVQLSAAYEARLPQAVAGLQLLVSDLTAEGSATLPRLQELHRRLHDVKGQAGTMGYELLGQLAALLHDVLALVVQRALPDSVTRAELLKLLRVGLAGMKLVADRRLRGEGGAAGARMRSELGAFADALRDKLGAEAMP